MNEWMDECYSLIDAEKSWLKNKCKNISPFVTDNIITYLCYRASLMAQLIEK